VKPGVEASRSSRRVYESWHAELEADDSPETPWYRLVQRHLDPGRDLAGRRVLEIGCGRGELSRWLAIHPAAPTRVVAADFALAALVKGSRAAGGRAPSLGWVQGDIQLLAHPDAVFDTVISCETVEHLPSPRLALAEIARVLAPGGRLLLTTPNYLGPMGLYRIWCRLRGRPYTEGGQPINRLTHLARTRSWVAGAGLRVTAIDAVGHYIPFPGRRPIELPALDRSRWLTRWFALHSLIAAEKP
jgi:SAM-dependent methyltransferase